MGYIEDILGALKGDNMAVRNDDSAIDRLSYRWTTILIVVFAGLVTVETYVISDRINCWVPAHFAGAWEGYTNDYCWIRNTYYLPFQEAIPRDLVARQKDTIIYYQWVPLLLLIQALLFYAPIMIWRSFNSRTGIDVNDIVETSEQVEKAQKTEDRNTKLSMLTRQMTKYLDVYGHKVDKGNKADDDDNEGEARPQEGKCNCTMICAVCCFCCLGRRFGNYMCILYLFTKILFFANAVAQLFLLNWFLGEEFNMYGIRLMKGWSSGERIKDSYYFPKVTLCDVEVRRLGNIHRYTVQCVLTMNLFNEKIYIFLWFWIFVVAAFAAYDLLMWTFRLFMTPDHRRFLQKRLSDVVPDFNYSRDKNDLDFFISTVLRPDGMLVLRLVDYNTNKLTMEDLAGALWNNRPKAARGRTDPDKESVPLFSPTNETSTV